LIGPLPYRYPLVSRLNRRLHKKLHRSFKSFLDPFVALELGKQVEGHLEDLKFDILLTNDLAIAGNTRTEKPIVLYTDAMLEKRYTENKADNAPLSNLSLLSLYLSRQTVRKGLHNATLVCYPAQWSCEKALEYGVPANKVRLIPWGANLADPGRDVGYQHSAHHLMSKERIDLLFVGKNWKGKGGDVALDVLLSLKQRGIEAHLHVVGLSRASLDAQADVSVYGYLDKAVPKQMLALSNLYSKCDAFLLPSVYEGFGIAYVEAAAYGLPSLGYQTTGVTTAVLHGKTGHLFPLGSSASKFANIIASWLIDPDKYQRLAQGARNYYEKVVNWEIATVELVDQIQKLFYP
jgi:glycosyltransferase involved in cell wall biosynthesis